MIIHLRIKIIEDLISARLLSAATSSREVEKWFSLYLAILRQTHYAKADR